jgi:hypothetical protein
MNYTDQETIIKELQQSLKGKVLLPQNDDYEQARQLWNGAVKLKPAIIILPETVKDVQAAVKFAGVHQLPFSVRGGGHDWAGRALNEGGVMINLQKLTNIYIDPVKKIATVQGGISGGELIAAAEPYGLVAVTGLSSVVGFTGLTLGGGYGPLSPAYGLAIDNLLSAEIVLADGTVVTASDTEHPDLFWAIRGGGGNFGVVTSLSVRLHTALPLLTGVVMFPWTEAETVLKGYAGMMASAPDELAIYAGMMPAPDGSPILSLVPVWHGDEAEGEKQIAAIRQLGTPFMVQVAPMKYSNFLDLFDAHIVNGNHYTVQTRWLSELNDDAILTMIKSINERSSSLSFINILHFHGASSRVPLADTAFGNRKPHFMMQCIAAWNPEDAGNSTLHEKWVRNLSDSMIKHALPGGYANLLGPDEHEQIAHAYGSNLSRLQKVKHDYDPENFFKGISIPR